MIQQPSSALAGAVVLEFLLEHFEYEELRQKYHTFATRGEDVEKLCDKIPIKFVGPMGLTDAQAEAWWEAFDNAVNEELAGYVQFMRQKMNSWQAELTGGELAQWSKYDGPDETTERDP